MQVFETARVHLDCNVFHARLTLWWTWVETASSSIRSGDVLSVSIDVMYRRGGAFYGPVHVHTFAGTCAQIAVAGVHLPAHGRQQHSRLHPGRQWRDAGAPEPSLLSWAPHCQATLSVGLF